MVGKITSSPQWVQRIIVSGNGQLQVEQYMIAGFPSPDWQSMNEIPQYN
jgi:hypothetical protein